MATPCPPSEMEAKYYYAGLPSAPPLVARSSTTPWEAPTGPEAYPQLKELRIVGNHAITEVWADNLAPKVLTLLDSKQVKWTSMDLVRIGIVGGSLAPVILWIGVMPASLSREDGVAVAVKCRELLVEHGITDVDVEIRESVVTRSARPKLLEPTSSNPTVNARGPLTATLGLPICAQLTPWAEGTGGFFIAEGGDSRRLLLVTARHVVFTPDKSDNKKFEHKTDGQFRHNVILLGDAAFKKFVESIKAEIGGKALIARHQEGRIRVVDGRDDPAANRERRNAQDLLGEATEAMEDLNTFYQDVSTRWATPESRVLGHVIFSPPIDVGAGTEKYTEDFAIIEMDASDFKDNNSDLGTQIPADELTRMMYPNLQNPCSFTYPDSGTISDEETRRPAMLDQNGDPCLTVLKRGNTTGLTIGRANDICSYARNYDDDNPQTSKEWAILPLDTKSGAFSAKGDSGSVIVDGLGRIGGLLTGSSGATSSSDVTYATPISFLLKRIQGYGFRNVNPELAA